MKRDWSTVDWSQHPDQIAAAMGVARSAVHYHKVKRGIQRPKKRIDWSGVEWGKHTCDEIAKQLGVASGVVRNKRSRLFGALGKYDWSKVD